MSAPTIAAIQRHAAAHYGVTVADLLSRRTPRKATHARHVAMWLCYRHTRHAASTIGRHFGNRDHTTVLSACKRLDARMEADAGLRADIDALSAMIAAAESTAACGDSGVRDAALALRSAARALEDRAARFDALASSLLATVELGSQPGGEAPR